MDDVAFFIHELLRTVGADGWAQTDAGYQWEGHNYRVKLRKSATSDIELVAEGYDGRPVTRAVQQPVTAEPDELTALLALLYQRVESKRDYRVAELSDVLRDLRDGPRRAGPAAR
jgi:hypothetical protein